MKSISACLILFVLFCIAIGLRFYLLPSHLFFGPEQGRDLLVVRDIVMNHKLTLIGSKTDISGIFHGPIFYYLATIPFVLAKGNPLFVSLFMIVIQSFSVLSIYFIGKDITNNKRVGFIAAGLCTISFLTIVYGRWLSNPPLSIPFALLCMWSIVRFLQGGRRYLFLTAVSFALLGQAEFINFLLYAVVALVVVVRFRKRISVTPLWYISLAAMSGIVISFGSYLLFDIRHGFLVSRSIFGLVSGSTEYGISFFDSIKSALLMFVSQFAMTMGIPIWQVGAICLVITLFILVLERKRYEYIDLLIMWLLVPVLILILLRHSVLEQLYVGLVPGMILAIAIATEWFIQKSFIVGTGLCLIVFLMNAYAYMNYFPSNSYVFFQSPQPSVRYSDQLEVVDRIYALANGKNFFFQSYTIPYFWQDAWDYLFWFRGTGKYGYIPKEEDKSDVYVIIQKDRSNPSFQADWYEKTVSTWGKRTEGFAIGEYTVEIRQPKL